MILVFGFILVLHHTVIAYNPPEDWFNENPDRIYIEEQYCKGKYPDAEYCYPFETHGPKYTIKDGIHQKNGTLQCGATIKTNLDNNGNKINSLSLANTDVKLNCPSHAQFAHGNLGNFNDTCVADPDLCAKLGLTVSFWLKIDKKDLDYFEQEQNYTYSYILSTGGQRSDSKGFVVLHEKAKNDSNSKFRIQLKITDGVLDIESNEIPMGTWSHLLFTWSESTGLKFYLNGILKQSKTPEDIVGQKECVDCSHFTNFTIGKPNAGERNYGKFLLDDLVIINHVVKREDINFLAGKSGKPTNNVYKSAQRVFLLDNTFIIDGKIVSLDLSNKAQIQLKNGASVEKFDKEYSLHIYDGGYALLPFNYNECNPGQSQDGMSMVFWMRRLEPDNKGNYTIDVITEKHFGMTLSYNTKSERFNFEFRHANEKSLFGTDFRIPFVGESELLWHFLAFTFKSNCFIPGESENCVVKVYINGDEKITKRKKGRSSSMFGNTTESNSTTWMGNNELVLGDAKSKEHLDFRLKDLALFCHVLKEPEISGLMGGRDDQTYQTEEKQPNSNGTVFEEEREEGENKQDEKDQGENKQDEMDLDSTTPVPTTTISPQEYLYDAPPANSQTHPQPPTTTPSPTTDSLQQPLATPETTIQPGSTEPALYEEEHTKPITTPKPTKAVPMEIQEATKTPTQTSPTTLEMEEPTKIPEVTTPTPLEVNEPTQVPDNTQQTPLDLNEPSTNPPMKTTPEPLDMATPSSTTEAPAVTQPPAFDVAVQPEDTTTTTTTTTPEPTTTSTTATTTTTETPTTTPEPSIFDPECPHPMDLIFVVDNSGSIESGGKEGYFKNVKSFFKSLASKFDVDNQKVRIAIVESSTEPSVIKTLCSNQETDDLEQVLNDNSMPAKKERSYLGRALDLVRTEVIDNTRDVGKIVVIVTDGYSTDDIRTPSKQLQGDGVIIFGVTFGPDSPSKQCRMKGLTSNPASKYGAMVNYDQLVEQAEPMKPKICKEATAKYNLHQRLEKMKLMFPLDKVKKMNNKLKDEILEEMNQYRHMHSSVALSWSDQSCKVAQQWAQYLASEKELMEKPSTRFGQALFVSDANDNDFSVKRAVKSWYNQIIDYDFENKVITEKNKYFAQLVWRSASFVCVGKAEDETGKSYIVAFFDVSALDDGDGDGVSCNVLPVNNFGQSESSGACATGYTSQEGYCYKFFADKKTWEEASMTCASEKSSLISITNTNEFTLVGNTMEQMNAQEAWIGLNDRVRENSLQWSDGSSPNFNGWVNPPIKDKTKRCVLYDKNGAFEKNLCQQKLPFFCKTVQPTISLSTVTINYPMDEWTNEIALGTSPQIAAITQRTHSLISTVYGDSNNCLQSAIVKSLRGHLSVYVDVELHFGTTCPTDPLKPLKDVVFTEDCSGFICDLADAQIMPGLPQMQLNSTFQSQCEKEYLRNLAMLQINQQQPSQQQYVAPQPQPPPPPPPPAMEVTSSIDMNCPSTCGVICSSTCPASCCSTQHWKKRAAFDRIKRTNHKARKNKSSNKKAGKKSRDNIEKWDSENQMVFEL